MTDPQRLDRRLPTLPEKENLVPTKPTVAPDAPDTPDLATTPDTGGPPSEPSTSTDDHLIDRALEGPAPPALRDYTADQLQTFSDRGIPVERARHYRISSVTPEETSLALGWRIRSSALRMPVPRNDEASPRYRIDYPDENTPRYLVAAGVKTHPFVTDLAHDAKAGDVLVVTEAPLKAIALETVGIRAIGAAGVWAGWRDS
ncbi:MAG: hypothetical protein B6A08_14065 [Sorangiineae bacterium NIC37A_2]|nr:MAG: hypothetical protein B6A08_14065 [Sorangiineae bacterium NIC37A_2]